MSTWFREETQPPGHADRAALECEVSKNALKPPRIIVQNGKVLDRVRFREIAPSLPLSKGTRIAPPYSVDANTIRHKRNARTKTVSAQA